MTNTFLQFVQIALRNLIKHRNRTLMVGGSLTFISMLLVLLLSLTAGIRKTILDNATALASGHVNVAGFYKISQNSATPLVTQYAPIEKLVHEHVPEATLFYKRVRGYGRIISDTTSIMGPVWGIDIANEKSIVGPLQAESGSIQSLEKPGNIVMFSQHAKKLGVKVGDAVTLSMPTTRNVYNTKDARVGGILKDLGLMSTFSLFMHEQDIRDIFQLTPDSTGWIMMYLPDPKKVPEIEERLRKLLAKEGHTIMEKDTNPSWMKFDTVSGQSWTGQRLDITTWEDETSYAKWILDMLGALTFVSISILLTIVVLGLVNTLWMAIRERTSEIGTLRAIGLQSRQVVLMFLLESSILSLSSILLGLFLGTGFAGLINIAHIPITTEAFQWFLMSNELHLSVRVADLAFTFGVLAFFLILSSLIPSYRAGKLKPITAINYVG